MKDCMDDGGMDDGEGRYGISRRMFFGGLTTVAFANAVFGAERQSKSTPEVTPQTPVEQMRLLMKMMVSVTAAFVPWFYTGRIYAVRAGVAPIHLYNFEGTEIYWVKPISPDSWSLAVSTLTFYRDRVSGEYLDHFENPLTGKMVEVTANVLRSKPGQSAIYSAGLLQFAGETQSVTMEVHRNGPMVWLTTSRANGHAPQPSMEINTLFARATDLDEAHRGSARSTFSSVSLSHWSKWLKMDDQDGHLLWHAAGRKLASIDELPASYRQRAAALKTDHFLDPESTPVAVPRAEPQAAVTPLAVPPASLRFSYVTGAGGVPLSVAEAGDRQAPGILFIHGLGQSHLSFGRQLHSQLSDRFHLVAFDLRGHGNSGKPWDSTAYSDSGAWCEDVARVIEATGLKRPVVVAWSYGTLVIADYIRSRGTSALAGIVMIGALGGLRSLPLSAFDPKAIARMQEMRQRSASPGLEDTLGASHDVVPFLTARPMPATWTATSETVNAMVPPFARTALSARMTLDNTDLVMHIQIPMLLLAGGEDRGTPQFLMQQLSDSLPGHAEVVVYEGSGHSAFAEEPDRFNADLTAFAMRAFAV